MVSDILLMLRTRKKILTAVIRQQDTCSRNSPNRSSLDRAYRTLEAPIRLLIAADRDEA